MRDFRDSFAWAWVLVAMIVLLTGCKTVSILSVISPEYEKYLLKGEKPPEDLEKWIDKKKLTLRGTGKNKVDMTDDKEKMENDSGFKIPFSDTSVRDLPTQN